MPSYIFVDVEADGPCPGFPGRLGMTEFGAVEYVHAILQLPGDTPNEPHNPIGKTFHGVIYQTKPSPNNRGVPDPKTAVPVATPEAVFHEFLAWLQTIPSPWVFVSDNPAFDWQWINHGFWITLGMNPFGYSARRISDFYAGLRGDWSQTMRWKRLRITKHDHNPVHDSIGNVEAFHRLLQGER